MNKKIYFKIIFTLLFTSLMCHAETSKKAASGSSQLHCNCSEDPQSVKLDKNAKDISAKIQEELAKKTSDNNDDIKIKGYSSCDGKQKGIASVYGIPGRDNFAGKRTANGEVMRPEKHRAAILKSASKQYPMGTWVRVSNGNKSVVVCINDTGGGKRGRVIDLSPAASKAIGNGDLGHVEVECIAKPTKKSTGRCDDKVAMQISQIDGF